MAVLTCQTENCPSAGVPVEMGITTENDEGESVRVDHVICGACGHEITDIQED